MLPTAEMNADAQCICRFKHRFGRDVAPAEKDTCDRSWCTTAQEELGDADHRGLSQAS